MGVKMAEIADRRIENGEDPAEYYDEGYPDVKELKDGVRIRKDLRMDAASDGCSVTLTCRIRRRAWESTTNT